MMRPMGRRSPWRAMLLAMLACALVVGAVSLSGCASSSPSGNEHSTTPDPTVRPTTFPMAGKVTPPLSGAYLGVFRSKTPWDMTDLDDYERVAGRRPAILMWYQAWDSSSKSEFDSAAIIETWQRGAIPMITWEPWDPTPQRPREGEQTAAQDEYTLAKIAGGEYDTYLRDWAKSAREVGGPIMIRPMHEMNGNWYPWGGMVGLTNKPETFVKAWRRMVTIFRQEKATNVTWVWSVNDISLPRNPDNTYQAYWPGDNYVDWTAISGFNWGTSRSTTSWRTFDDIYSEPLAYLQTKKKPIALAEMASVEKGGDKAAWITQTYASIRQHPEIKAVVYFDAFEQHAQDSQDWLIQSSLPSERAYAAAVANPYFVGGPAQTLDAWLGQLSATDWLYLRKQPPVY